MEQSHSDQQKPKRVLIVAPHFAPINAPDGHRVRQSIRYFRDFGWDAEILSVDPRDIAAPADKALEAALPTDIRIHRCKAIRLRYTQLFGLRTLGWRALPEIQKTGCRLLGRNRFDLVYFSTTQWPVLLAGGSWLKRFRVPYIVDIQDPWYTDYYSRSGAPKPPGGWKYALAHRMAGILEKHCFRRASGFISVSDDYLSLLSRRYSWFHKIPQITVPFGADELEFQYAQSLSSPIRIKPEEHYTNITYVGAASPIMRSSLEFLFSTLRLWTDANPGEKSRLRFHFIGTSYAMGHARESYVTTVAQRFGVQDLVTEVPERIGYFDALNSLYASDIVLVLGSDDRGYSPSKIANVVFAGHPILALLPKSSQAEAPLRASGIASLFESTPHPDQTALLSWFQNYSFRTKAPTVPSIETKRQLHARTLTQRQAELFDQVVRQHAETASSSSTSIR